MKGTLSIDDFRSAGTIVAADSGCPITDPVVVIDSREAVAGSVFVALPGVKTDGHQFVHDVFTKGAAWAVVARAWFESRGHEFMAAGRRFLVADSPEEALQRLAACYRSRFDIPVVGIGGSNGKTTTKEMVAAVLGTRHAVHMSKGNLNNHLGVPLTLLSMRHDTEIAVVEMGINHPGEMELLTSIARPTHGLLTNIGHEHLEFFGSLEGVADAEAALFRFLDDTGGTAFVNLEDHRLVAGARGLSHRIDYGAAEGHAGQWWAESVTADAVGRISFTLCSAVSRQPVAMQFVGRHNVINAVAAATVGACFGVGPAEVAEGLGGLLPAKGWKRMELLEGGGIVVINDTYNANPDSVRHALDTLAGMGCAGRKIAVIGDMLELGSCSDVEHDGIGVYIQQVPIDGVCTYGEMARRCCRNAGNRCLGHFEDMEELNRFLAGYVRKGDAVLFKGSRGMRLELAAESLLRSKTETEA